MLHASTMIRRTRVEVDLAASLCLLAFLGGYLVWNHCDHNAADKYSYELTAKFRDASGLPKGSKVVVAGLAKGQVTDLEVEGRYARITFKISRDIDVYKSGVVIKKASSLLGEQYLEIDPGEKNKQMPDGTTKEFHILGPDCDGYDGSDAKKDEECRLVPNIIESTTPDQLLRRIEQSVPKLDEVLVQARGLAEDLRAVVIGPLKNVATRVDSLVQKESDTVARAIERADRALANIEAIANNVRMIVNNADPQVASILNNLDAATADAEDLVATAKRDLENIGK